MPSANLGAIGRRATLASALAILIGSAPAHAVVINVDGNLSDIMALTGDNTASGTESGSDGENNGFDITNMYAHYDIATDTFYLGMSMFGQVGTSGGDEGSGNFPWNGLNEDGVAGVFDSNESYGFSLFIAGNPNNPTFRLDLEGDGVANSGPGSENVVILDNPYSATYSWAVSEANNGVEFRVTGLAAQLGNFSYSNPTDVTINYFAGSISNAAAEDVATLNMQVVPVPAAVWLFGSGLLGLVGISRRRRA